ncbi:MAG: adenylate kinase [Oscillospiraceae bacterium]|jgi:adenylate kinase|nr:adenylate kinase [Oscillospiraceae bacterium]MCI1989939.1 adenylate kinase [Oscillospiraceae bacterium]MCI2034969.1 adenylate kinase [Oscillospiraceae bacterium]
MNLIFLGAPGAGKGTHAEILSREIHIPQISTGNMIREALKSGTEMGLKAKAYIEAGNLVPDEVVIGIIRERLNRDDCKNGFILDGFPRTIPQAEALDKMIRIDRVIDIEVPESLILRRLSGRRVCGSCGASYNIHTRKPKVEGVCDTCGGTLVQRKDDQPETVKARLKVYHEQTEPLTGYYKKQGKLRTVHGSDDTAATHRDILNAVEA